MRRAFRRVRFLGAWQRDRSIDAQPGLSFMDWRGSFEALQAGPRYLDPIPGSGAFALIVVGALRRLRASHTLSSFFPAHAVCRVSSCAGRFGR